MNDLPGPSLPRCRACGNALRPSARFCDLCGGPVSEVRTAGERKHITVLFADVVQSMALAATLGPERLQEVMYELFNRSAEAVQRYQGTVDKFTGDGLMAVFGAPLALEQHALRACMAGRDIQAVARTLAVAVRERDRADLRLRVGLNSGEVIAAEMGAGPTSYTVIGHPVGMAQRIESAADPGGVLCSEWTARMAGPAAVFGPAHSVAVKGSTGTVVVRPLESIRSDIAFLGRDDGPMVGRSREMTALVELLDAGAAGVVCVVGDPGVGKSRLLREFSVEAAARRGRIVTVRCEAHTVQIPLQAASRLLRSLFDVHGLDDDAARARISGQLTEPADLDVVLDLLSLRGDVSGPGLQMNAEVRRSRLVEVMVKRAKAERPASVYVVEDLHWIDAASEELLHDFVTALDDQAPLVVATARPGYYGAIRASAHTTIAVSPLTESDVAVLLNALVGQQLSSHGVARRIAQASGGNPYFLEEIVRDLVDRGVLTGRRGSYRLVREETSIPVPGTVQALIAARIDRLSEDEKSILNAAAVIGSTFDAHTLDALIPRTDPGLRTLLAAELIDQIELLPVTRYQFRHPLVRAVCYEAQLRITRASSHRRLAHFLQSKRREFDDHGAGLIAHHCEAADELDSAYTEYMRSAAWLFHRDVGAARASWRRAKAVADRMPGGDVETRIAPRAQLSFTAWLVGENPDEEDCLSQLRQLTEDVDDATPLALGLAGQINSLVINHCRPRDAVALVAEVEALYENVGGSDWDRAEIVTTIALAHYSTGAFDDALLWIDRLRTSGLQLSPYSLTAAVAMSGVIKVLSGQRADGRHDLNAARELGLASDPMNYAGAVAYSVDCVVLGFDIVDEALLRETERALGLAQDYGDASGHAAYGLSLARWAHGTALIMGDRERRSEGVRLLELCRSAEEDMTVGPVAAQLAAEYGRLGEIDDDALSALHTQVLTSLATGNVCFVGYCAAEVVRLLLARNRRSDVATAEDVVAKLEGAFDELHQPAMDLWPLLCRLQLVQASGDSAAFREVLSRYRDLAHRLQAAGHLAMIDEMSVPVTAE